MGANGERVTRSESVIVTGRRVGQGAGQEKGSGVRTELPFLDRFKPVLEALVEIRGVEPLTSYMRSKRSTN